MPHESLQLKTALVTGASNTTGRRLVSLLRSQGWRVTAAVNPASSAPIPPGAARVVKIDLASAEPITLPPGIDTIFHLEEYVPGSRELDENEAACTAINTNGTGRLLDAAKDAGVGTFIYFSTVQAAAPAPHATQPIDETWYAPPLSPYGLSKRLAENLVLNGDHVPHPVVLRSAPLYGPGKMGNLLRMARAINAGYFPPLPNLNNKRSMVHVDDLCRAAVLATLNVNSAGKLFIVADSEPVSARQLYVWIRAALGRSIPDWSVSPGMLRLAGWFGDGVGRAIGRRFPLDSAAVARLTENAWYSFARIERELNWRPAHSLRSSLFSILQTLNAETVGQPGRGLAPTSRPASV